jgi:hypothetical protein
MPQVTVNIEAEDKKEIIRLASLLAPKIKQNKVSQAAMVHTMIEVYKEVEKL